MKARVKATGKTACIEEILAIQGYVASDGKIYNACDLELIVDNEPDYWTRLEHQAAIAAMQGILSNSESELDYKDNEALPQAIAACAAKIAHALVEKYKKEEK